MALYSSTDVIDSLPQLKGKRIAIGPEGSDARKTAKRILSKANVNEKTVTSLPFGGDAAVKAINDGEQMQHLLTASLPPRLSGLYSKTLAFVLWTFLALPMR